MGKKSRFWLAVMTVVLLLTPFVSAPLVLAKEETLIMSPAMTEAEITLEQAITTAKMSFEPPETYTEFFTRYSTYNDRPIWSLIWEAPGNSYGRFSVEIDAIRGDILSMYHWKENALSAKVSLLQPVSREEAQKISDELLARLLGERAKDLKLLPGAQRIGPLYTYESEGYLFQYQREINGIPFLNNGAYVRVSGTDGHIITYTLYWDEVKAPEGKGIIEMKQAEKAFKAIPDFKLFYIQPASYRLLAAGEEQDAKLVYQLTGRNGGAVDAFTGEPLKLDQGSDLEMGFRGPGIGQEVLLSSGSSSNVPALTHQEQQEVEFSAQLLKQDEAVAVVRKWLEIPASLTLGRVNLAHWDDSKQRYWILEWSNIGSVTQEGEPEYLDAVVDAVSGELIAFECYYQPTGNPETALDQQAGQNVAEEFLRKIQPEKFGQVKLLDQDNDYGEIMFEFESTKYFFYQRTANGIDFWDNGMMVGVDATTGYVVGYLINWSDSVLPSVADIMSKEESAKLFLQASPLKLVYVQPYTNGVPSNLRLVYLPVDQERSSLSSNILDAKSGEFLDYLGQPLKEGPKPYVFTDLTGVDGAQEIGALGRAGLFGEYGNSFKPREKIEIVSLLRAMYLAYYGVNGNTVLSDEEIMSRAKDRGWLKEELQPDDAVSRELLAKVLVRYMSLNEVAEIKDIYHIQFDDADQISPDALGYVALVWSSGILKVEGQSLAPREEVSRAEAALALVRVLNQLLEE